MITAPFASLDAWVAYLGEVRVPVLRHTAKQIAEFAADEDSVGERALAATVLHDPLLSVQVLAYIEAHRRRSQNADITTVEHAILMLGIGPFFRAFSELPVVEDQLRPFPDALLGLLRVVGRARSSAQHAREWAIARHDLDVEEITVAALLHDIAEILLWCFAPELSLRIRALQRAQKGLRSESAQRAVLGITILDLQLALARAWHLPSLLQDLMDDRHAENPRVKNVALAVRLARHKANGWGDPALPDDYREIAALLRIPVEDTMGRIGVPVEARPTLTTDLEAQSPH